MDGIKGDDLALLEEELKLSDPVDSRLDQEAHEAYVVPDGFRGIQEAVVGPGRYYVNTLAVTPVVIPTTNQTVEWTAEQIKGSLCNWRFAWSSASSPTMHRLWLPRLVRLTG